MDPNVKLHKTLKRLVSDAISSRFSKKRDPKKDCYDQVTEYLIEHGVRVVRFTSEAECLEDLRNLTLEAERRFATSLSDISIMIDESSPLWKED